MNSFVVSIICFYHLFCLIKFFETYKSVKKGLTFRERMMFVFGACQDYTFLSELTFLSHFNLQKSRHFSFFFKSVLCYITFILFSLISFISFNKVIGKNQLNHK